MADSHQEFLRFLSHILSQKEVSLVIAKDAKELEELHNILNRHDFKESKNAVALQENAKTPSQNYIVLDRLSDKDLKDAYDFCVQYPTGQVELYDRERAQTTVISLNYKDTAVIFCATKEVIFTLQKQGLNILGAAGLAYQSKA